MRLLFVAALLAVLPTSVLADEVWETADGTVVYLADEGDLAIWELESADGVVRMYLPGLGGNFDNRSVHDGYWIRSGKEQGCSTTLTGPDGHSGSRWGKLTIVFHTSGFPTNWTMLNGNCFDDPSNALYGESPVN